jgi:hypothetical protein
MRKAIMPKKPKQNPNQEIAVLRVSFGGKRSIARNIEIRQSASLYALAETIIVDAFDWDLDHAFGFFDNLKNPYDSMDRYELFADMNGCDNYGAKPKSVKKTKIGDVFDALGKKMLFLFDYGDENLFTVELLSFAPKEPKSRYPLVSNVKGKSPEQYPACD